MTDRERELMLLMYETEIKNIKIILQIRTLKQASEAEINHLLDKLHEAMNIVKELKDELNQ